MHACLKAHMREVIDCFALFAWLARAALLAGIVKAARDKACNECKTLGQLGLVCVEMLRHKCSFPNSHFI